MSRTESLTDRLHAFARMVVAGDHNVRNHLSATGSTADVAALLEQSRVIEDGQTVLILGDQHLPVAYQERRHRAHAGAWVTVTPGQEPASGSSHAEESEAVFAFPSDRAFGDEVTLLSEQHPQLEFRYAWFEHRGEEDDVARGGLWKAGHRVVEHVGVVQALPPDTEQLAALVRTVESLDEPVTAGTPAR